MTELKSVAKYVTDKIDVSQLNVSEYISTDNMIPNRGGIVDCVSLPQATRVTRYTLGDTLVSNIRPYFKKIWYANRTSGCSNDIIVFRVLRECWNSKFLYYVLSQDSFFDYMMASSNGTKMPRGNKKIIPDFVVPDFDFEKQTKISDILSVYDDLIENNQKQIRLLEEAAQRLYKEWFVDLRFPGHKTTPIVDGLPEEWEKNCANHFFDITIGKTPPRAEKQWFTKSEGVPWSSISDMGNSGIFVFNTTECLTEEAVSKHNVKKIPNGTVILSFKLTVGRVSITATEMCTNEAIAHFYVNDDTRYYTYLYLKMFPYDELGNTSSISKAINSKIVKSMPFIMPSTRVLNDFNKTVVPIFSQICCLQKQIRNLTEARNRLLPKLMNGEIEV